jgi:hypothetical protein
MYWRESAQVAARAHASWARRRGATRVDDCKPQMVKALLGQKRAEGVSEKARVIA